MEHNDEPNTHRVRASDIAEAIHSLRPEKQAVSVKEDPSVIAYTIKGQQDAWEEFENLDPDTKFPVVYDEEQDDGTIIPAQNQDQAFAIRNNDGEARRYYIRRNSDGKLFNPKGLYTEHKHNKDIHNAYDSQSAQFVQVNRKTFVHYLQFLRTVNVAWLHNAERERF